MTLMRSIAGLLANGADQIHYRGRDISQLRADEVAELGLAMVPEGRQLFPSLSVKENLMIGAQVGRAGPWNLKAVYDLFPILKEKRRQYAGELSGGQRQQVAVGRALMTNPSVLMLDEPTAGVSPIVMDELFDRILEIKKLGIAILMVEQNARQALAIADIGFVMVSGETRYEDTGAALLANPEVRRSFLGG